ncbi:hypothetical protein SS50377_21710 [Spironucleus salmonicida]|uniref:Uncharacterized protein n=1 Tax=Spironucleus salmonicida TaxID=348837 RepID=V6LDU5_9EUKA|nr:hypothetical protein SS50377_21710 [Spironucleus salmonicida]|eukprot:EST42652.1 Hypothetical protein SS50377_17760 [Spironucleus salmonicida]
MYLASGRNTENTGRWVVVGIALDELSSRNRFVLYYSSRKLSLSQTNIVNVTGSQFSSYCTECIQVDGRVQTKWICAIWALPYSNTTVIVCQWARQVAKFDSLVILPSIINKLTPSNNFSRRSRQENRCSSPAKTKHSPRQVVCHFHFYGYYIHISIWIFSLLRNVAQVTCLPSCTLYPAYHCMQSFMVQ